MVFGEGKKFYYYLAKDTNIRVGDEVLVPVSRSNEEKLARIVKVEVFRENATPIPANRLKYIVELQDEDR